MSLEQQVRALKIHLERSIEAANMILELVSLDTDTEVSSGDSDYASTDEIEIYIPPAPPLVRSETYLDNPVDRPGTPSLLGPPPLPAKVYKKINIDRFDE